MIGRTGRVLLGRGDAGVNRQGSSAFFLLP
jgi:hypothetical protein